MTEKYYSCEVDITREMYDADAVDRVQRPPDRPARCTCSQLTHWYWYEDEPDPDDPEPYGEWTEALCWRCSQIFTMKAEMTLARLGLEPGGRLKPAPADRFVEIALSTDGLRPEEEIVEVEADQGDPGPPALPPAPPDDPAVPHRPAHAGRDHGAQAMSTKTTSWKDCDRCGGRVLLGTFCTCVPIEVACPRCGKTVPAHCSCECRPWPPCSKCKTPVDPAHAAPKPGEPLLCLDCLYPGGDIPAGTPLEIHEGEAQDVIPADERETP